MSGILLMSVGNSYKSAPGAPTIGTATQTGPTTATVGFTAPATNGGSVITSYTATSSPGSITATLVQSGSGTITVTGLTTDTSYTFTVTATNAIGTSPPSAASNSVTPVLPVIGASFGGGFYAGQIGVSGVATHLLVVGPLSSAQTTSTQWKNATTATSGADSAIDGPQNTADMVADGNSTVYPAAHFCNDLTIGGFSDWYMPAKNELEVCYYNLKPDATANNTGGTNGVNPNAIPPRASNYTAGTPGITSAVIFQTGNAQAFSAPNFYWSSTETAATTALRQYFYTGNQANGTKNSYLHVRGIRRVAV